MWDCRADKTNERKEGGRRPSKKRHQDNYYHKDRNCLTRTTKTYQLALILWCHYDTAEYRALSQNIHEMPAPLLVNLVWRGSTKPSLGIRGPKHSYKSDQCGENCR